MTNQCETPVCPAPHRYLLAIVNTIITICIIREINVTGVTAHVCVWQSGHPERGLLFLPGGDCGE